VATLLPALGSSAINETAVKNILYSVGIEYEAEKVNKVVAELARTNLGTPT
jgi:ribosomal protein L12E/L44/L45/RPP1/RPP2